MQISVGYIRQRKQACRPAPRSSDVDGLRSGPRLNIQRGWADAGRSASAVEWVNGRHRGRASVPIRGSGRKRSRGDQKTPRIKRRERGTFRGERAVLAAALYAPVDRSTPHLVGRRCRYRCRGASYRQRRMRACRIRTRRRSMGGRHRRRERRCN